MENLVIVLLPLSFVAALLVVFGPPITMIALQRWTAPAVGLWLAGLPLAGHWARRLPADGERGDVEGSLWHVFDSVLWLAAAAVLCAASVWSLTRRPVGQSFSSGA